MRYEETTLDSRTKGPDPGASCDQRPPEPRFEEIIGSNPAVNSVLMQIEQVAPTDSTVLVLGEAGTGKASDNQIVVAIRAGSPAAFAELHANYSRRLYKTILAITKHPEDAEDALQETFLRAHLALHTFEGRSNIYSWLTRIAINSALMILRRRRARPEILFHPQHDPEADTSCYEVRDSAPDPEQVYDQHQRQAKVVHEIRRLKPKLRETIQMQVAQSRSIKEISRALNVSEATVKARLHRARQRLSALSDFKPRAAELRIGGKRLRPTFMVANS